MCPKKVSAISRILTFSLLTREFCHCEKRQMLVFLLPHIFVCLRCRLLYASFTDSNRQASLLLFLVKRMFVCYNMNCYSQFRTERGLQQHLWHSSTRKGCMLQQRCTDAGIETINTSRYQAYGVQCTRLNYEMNAKFPLYAPYKGFQYDTANDFDADDTLELDNMYSQLDGFASSISGLENVSPFVLHGTYESKWPPKHSEFATWCWT